jgi:hypothetical protein
VQPKVTVAGRKRMGDTVYVPDLPGSNLRIIKLGR